jgi:hypothetical protein
MIRKKSNSTIEDIHQFRSEVSSRFGGDVFAIAEDAARRQAASDRPVWKPKHDEQSDARETSSASALKPKSNSRSP